MEIGFLIAAICLGFLTGIITGLIPGLHVNTVAALMVSVSAILYAHDISPIALAIYVSSTAITHSFYDFVPSLFLGIPTDESYALLPGQKMVKEGRGLEALHLSVIGSWRGLLFSVLALCILVFVATNEDGAIKAFERSLQPWMFYILIFISITLIYVERNRLWAIIVFIFSGVYGLIVFSSPLVPGGTMSSFNVLFPALTGLFGVSGLVQSLIEKTMSATKQEVSVQLKVTSSQINTSAFIGSASGMFVGLLPGLGGANAATLVLLLNKFISKSKQSINQGMTYILMTSAINTSDTLFGIAALYLIDKSRSGASVAIDQLLKGTFSLYNLSLIIIAMLIVGFLAKITLMSFGIAFAKLFSRMNNKALSLSVLIFIIGLVFLTTGKWGLLILLGSSFLGMIPPLVNVKRAQSMGFFLVPVLLFFSGFQREVSTLLQIEAKLSPAPDVNLLEFGAPLILITLMCIFVYLLSSKMFASK